MIRSTGISRERAFQRICFWWTATIVLAVAAGCFDTQSATAQSQPGSSIPAVPSDTTPAVTPQVPTKSAFDASMTTAITSDYNYRGYTLSDHNPSVSADFEATYGSWYLDVGGASVQMPNLSHFQMTDYAGVRPAFGSLTIDTGIEYY